MFPVAACKAVQSVLKGSADSMEEAIEAKGLAAFPTLDMVRVGLQASSRARQVSQLVTEMAPEWWFCN